MPTNPDENKINAAISNTDNLMSRIGDFATNNSAVKTVVDNYSEINKEFNEFLDKYITDTLKVTTAPTTEDEKIKTIVQRTAKDRQSDFISKLQDQVENRNAKRLELKTIAENILKEQNVLLEENKKIIEDLEKSYKEDIDRKNEIGKSINDCTTEITRLGSLISNLEGEITNLEKDIKQLEGEIAKSHDNDEIKAKKEEISNLRKEIKDKRNLISNHTDEKNAKEKEKSDLEYEKNNLFTDSSRQDKINELKNKNTELAKKYEKNSKDFINLFGKDGINIQTPSMTHENGAPETPTNESNSQAQGNANSSRSNSAQSGFGNGVPTQNNNQSTSVANITDKQRAQNMAREYMETKTLEEQRNVIDKYGYTDLVAMMRELPYMGRKKMRDDLKYKMGALVVPPRDKFIKVYEYMLGDGSELYVQNLYDSLFKNGKVADFKKLNVENIRNIQLMMEWFNNNRDKLEVEDPDSIEIFELTFAKFVKMGALIERSHNSKIRQFFADRFLVTQRQAGRKNLAASMRDYTNATTDREISRQTFENNIRRALGQEVEDNVPNPQRVNPRAPSELERLDEERNGNLNQR